MSLSALDVSYCVLAPVSTLSGLLFLSVFLVYPTLRKSPNWQTVAQTVFGIHWFSAFLPQR